MRLRGSLRVTLARVASQHSVAHVRRRLTRRIRLDALLLFCPRLRPVVEPPTRVPHGITEACRPVQDVPERAALSMGDVSGGADWVLDSGA